MKIIHVIDHLSLGGAQSLIKEIFENDNGKSEIFLFSLRNTNNDLKINHKNIFISKSVFKFSFSPLFKLVGIIRKQNIELVHCHLFRSQVFGFLIKIFFVKKSQIIFHEHGQIYGSERRIRLDDFFYIKFLKLAGEKVAKFIAVSFATKNKLMQRAGIPSNKIDVIYNFIDHNYFKKKDNNPKRTIQRQILNLSDSHFVIGFAGRLIKTKGWQSIIESAETLKSQETFRFIIAGRGPDKDEIINTIRKKKLQDQFVLLDQVKNMPDEFYEIIDCFVLTSKWESMGLVAIEAQSMKIPVIASNVPALNELLTNEENVLFFEFGNAVDLTDKILELYRNPELRSTVIEKGYIASQKYNFKTYNEQLNNLYSSLIIT